MSRSLGFRSLAAAIAAAVPAAWPVARQTGIRRSWTMASCCADMQRPATRSPSTASGTRDP